MLSKKEKRDLPSLNHLYHYVFTKEAVNLDLSEITQNPSLSNTFRYVLQRQNPEREIQLYGNFIEQVPTDTFPTEEQIGKKFEELNNQYRYLPNTLDTKNKFAILFKGAKLIADFIEQNNSKDNGVAYLHAYKLFILFGYDENKQRKNPFFGCEHFLKKFILTQKSNFPKPIHDMLVHSLGINNKEEAIIKFSDLNQWRAIIGATGFAAIQLFAIAPEIQQLLRRAPQDYAEAESQKMAINYKNYKENPQLARLCLFYNVHEETFNKCLKIKPKLIADELPDVVIGGNLCNQKGYYLVKLPSDDPSAYILGHITNCCQSIDGDSEQCVIDGITRGNNGFYVLLKAKTKDTKNPLLYKNGQSSLNHKEYHIVGQGYAWRSNFGNLTFDSWENLRPDADDNVIVPLLIEFAKKVTSPLPDQVMSKQAPTKILRVTIGTGGKTPKAFTDQNTLKHPERMAEGDQYDDSKIQVLIRQNDEEIHKREEHLRKIWPSETAGFTIWSSKQAEWLELLAQSKSQYSKEYPKDYDQLLNNIARDIHQLEIVILLHEEKLLTLTTYQTLTQHTDKTKEIADALTKLHQTDPKLICDETLKLLAQHVDNASPIAYALATLHQVNPELISHENRQLLAQNANHAADIALAFVRLHLADPNLIMDEMFKFLAHNASIAGPLAELYEIDPKLINDKNRQLLAQNVDKAGSIIHALTELYKINSQLIHDENFKLLVQNANHAWGIADALTMLYQANPQLIHDENFKLLVQNASHAWGIANTLTKLYQINPQLIHDENFKLLTQNAENAWCIADALTTLHKTNPKLISDENFKLLAHNTSKTWRIAYTLNELYEINPILINDENFNLLAQHVNEAWHITNALTKLSQADPQLIHDEHFKLLAQNAENASNIADVLVALHKADPYLLHHKNRQLLAQNAKNAWCIADALVELYKVNPKLIHDENFNLLARNANDAWLVTSALTKLYQADPQLTHDEHFKLLAQNTKNASHIADALIELHKADPQLIHDKNFKFPAENREHTSYITQVSGIKTTKKKKRGELQLRPNPIEERFKKLVSISIINKITQLEKNKHLSSKLAQEIKKIVIEAMSATTREDAMKCVVQAEKKFLCKLVKGALLCITGCIMIIGGIATAIATWGVSMIGINIGAGLLVTGAALIGTHGVKTLFQTHAHKTIMTSFKKGINDLHSNQRELDMNSAPLSQMK